MRRELLAEVIEEAGRLGLAWWERLALILAVALLRVLGRRGFAALKNLKLEEQIVMDEGGPPSPGVDLPTDPDNPGGGPYGGGQG